MSPFLYMIVYCVRQCAYIIGFNSYPSDDISTVESTVLCSETGGENLLEKRNGEREREREGERERGREKRERTF